MTEVFKRRKTDNLAVDGASRRGFVIDESKTVSPQMTRTENAATGAAFSLSSTMTFPEELMTIIEDQEHFGDAIQWNEDGTVIAVIPKSFIEKVLEKRFPATKFETFTRKLNRWGFERVMNKWFVPEAIAYQHRMFQRGKLHLLSRMKKSDQQVRKKPSKVTPPTRTSSTPPEYDGPGTTTTSSLRHDMSYQALLSRLATCQQRTMQTRTLERRASLSSSLGSVPPISTATNTLTKALVLQHQLQSRREIEKEIMSLRYYQELQQQLRATRILESAMGTFPPAFLQQVPRKEIPRQTLENLLPMHTRGLSPVESQLPHPVILEDNILAASLLSRGQANGTPSYHQPTGGGILAQMRTASAVATSARSGTQDLMLRRDEQDLPSSFSSSWCTPATKRKREEPQPFSLGGSHSATSSHDSGKKPPSRFLEQQWDDLFQQIKQYREKFGNCLVPQHGYQGEASPQLARWVKRQRYQYKLMKEGRPCNMTAARVQALESIGFVWDSHSSVWQERINELKEYRRVHGHCNVASNYTENTKLAAWVKCQRRQYKLYSEGRPSNMSPERIRALERIGFEWQLRGKHNR